MSTNKEKILIVEDDDRLSRLIGRYLERADFITEMASNGIELHERLKSDTFSLILLDIMLPGKSGLVLAQEIRQSSDIPIIFLTAKSDVSDKVNGLDIGADDYITKPFEEEELLARIQSVLRRAYLKKSEPVIASTSQIYFAGWRLNTINQTLSSPQGTLIDITSSEYQVLAGLTKHNSTVLSREEILTMISDREWSPLDRSADMIISKLRKKIELDPKNPVLIKTIRSKGYQLTADIKFKKPD